jgi:hypothetical protein
MLLVTAVELGDFSDLHICHLRFHTKYIFYLSHDVTEYGQGSRDMQEWRGEGGRLGEPERAWVGMVPRVEWESKEIRGKSH